MVLGPAPGCAHQKGASGRCARAALEGEVRAPPAGRERKAGSASRLERQHQGVDDFPFLSFLKATLG